MEQSFIKGSSLPKREETPKDSIRKRINPECVFKKSGHVIPVSEVKNVSILKLKEGDFLCGDNQRWNTFFEGSATISVPDENGTASCLKTLEGHANVDDNDDVEGISEISIYDWHGKL